MPGMDMGIDLGTSCLTVSVAGRGVVLREPSVIAVRSADDKRVACGQEAYDMLGRSPDSLRVVRPVEKGVIADYDYAQRLLQHGVRRVCKYKILKPCAGVSIPAGVTEVEQRALVDAVRASGVRRVVMVETCIAAALGAGIDITAPLGSLMVNVGGGMTNAAVLTLRGVAASRAMRVGGDDLNAAIVRYVHDRYGLLIGDRTAETLKRALGDPKAMPMRVKGRRALDGLPAAQPVGADEVREAIAEPLRHIVGVVQQTLEAAPPELVGDVLRQGLCLTGGCVLLDGLPALLEAETGVACRVADNPADCVALGAVMALRQADRLPVGVYTISQLDDTQDTWNA